jgi:hypothetical protein
LQHKIIPGQSLNATREPVFVNPSFPQVSSRPQPVVGKTTLPPSRTASPVARASPAARTIQLANNLDEVSELYPQAGSATASPKFFAVSDESVARSPPTHDKKLLVAEMFFDSTSCSDVLNPQSNRRYLPYIQFPDDENICFYAVDPRPDPRSAHDPYEARFAVKSNEMAIE